MIWFLNLGCNMREVLPEVNMKSQSRKYTGLLLSFVMTAVLVTMGNTQETYAKSGRIVASNSVKDTTTGETVAINISSDKDTESDSSSSAMSGSIDGIPYSELVMANVSDSVNVREEASEDATIAGKLFKGCGGKIIEKGSDWTKIQSGDLVGWVKNTYLYFGDSAVSAAKSSAARMATANTDTLRVRKEASENGSVLGLIGSGDSFVVIEELGDWVSIEWEDGETGYVASRYVDVDVNLAKGLTMAAIKNREEIEKSVKEKEKAAETAAKVEASRTTETTKTNNGAISGEVNDVLLLAALIQAEAGNEIYEGQVSVGTVVMNRLRMGKYGNTLYSVIYAKSQFGPAASGQVAQIYAMGPKASCISAAQEAMNGTSYIGLATHFRNVKSGNPGIVIGNHVFW